jgi:hypothetical protein
MSAELESADQVMIRLVEQTDWKTENRVGVSHFAPGQIQVAKGADDEGDEVMVLVYAPIDGHGLNGLFCVNERGFWEAAPIGIRFTRRGQSILKLPDTFMLSRAMTAALDRDAST